MAGKRKNLRDGGSDTKEGKWRKREDKLSERVRAASSVVRPPVGRKIVRSEGNETGRWSLDYIIIH